MPDPSAVTFAVAAPLRATVAPFPPVPLITPEMLHGQLGAAVIVMLSGCVAVCDGFPESVTCALKFVVPAAVSVPAIWPPDESVSPGGNVVAFAKDQEYD